MKSIKIIISFCLLLSFASCDSEEENQVDEQSIIGTWSVTALEADIELTTSFQGIPISSNINSVGENFDYTVVFTESTYMVEGSYDLVSTGTINGIPIDTDTQSITGIEEEGTYSLDIDEGIIEFDGNVFDFESNDIMLSELSGSQELNIAFDANGNLILTQVLDTTIEQDGIEADSTIDARVVLSPN